MVGGAAALLALQAYRIVGMWNGVPAEPIFGSWRILLGQKEAWGGIARVLSWSLNNGLVIVFLLVIARRILRRPALAVIGAFVIQNVPNLIFALVFSEDFSTAEVVSFTLFDVVGYAGLVVVVLRWGLVGGIVMRFVWFLALLASTADWSAWHAQPAILATIVVGALALYGYWAATPRAAATRMSPAFPVS